MPGWSTNGLPTPTLPLTLNEKFAADSQLSSGVQPQSEAITLQNLSAVHAGQAKAVTYASTVTLDCTANSYFRIGTLTGNVTANLTNPAPGQVIYLYLTQDGTGSRTLTVTVNGTSSTAVWAGGATGISTAASSVDLVRLQYDEVLGKVIGCVIAKAIA